MQKLVARYPRTLAILALAARVLPFVLVRDNSDLAHPFRFVAEYRYGIRPRRGSFLPDWFRALPDAE